MNYTILKCGYVALFAFLIAALCFAIGWQKSEKHMQEFYANNFVHMNPCAIDQQTKQRIVSGSVDTVYGGDFFGDILYTNPDGTEESLPDLNNFPPPFHFRAKSATFGPVTIKPQEGTIDGQPQITIKQGECVEIHVVKGKYEAYRCEPSQGNDKSDATWKSH